MELLAYVFYIIIHMISQGYKHTEIGIIPQEWEVKNIRRIAKCFSGGTPNSKDSGLYGGNIPFIRSGEIHGDSTAIYLTEKGLNNSSAKMVNKGDLLYALYGANSGDCAISQIDGAINQAILCIRSNTIMNAFLQPYLELSKDKYIAKYLQGGQGNLSNEIISSYIIPIPPLEEQQKIAKILGMWDKAIELQSKIIDKLELRKRALMQRLLSGHQRLPGFSTPWEKVRLGTIGDTFNGLTGKSKDDFERGNSKYIPYINVFSNERIDINNLECVQIESEERQNAVKYGDIFFTVSSETPDEVGMSSVLLEHVDNTYLNSFCFGYRLKDFSILAPSFAVYLLRTEYFRTYITILAQGSTRFNISKKEVMKLKIVIPSIKEQAAITAVLSMATKEIELARAKLVALRAQKRGLMQQLLTGKKRAKY